MTLDPSEGAKVLYIPLKALQKLPKYCHVVSMTLNIFIQGIVNVFKGHPRYLKMFITFESHP